MHQIWYQLLSIGRSWIKPNYPNHNSPLSSLWKMQIIVSKLFSTFYSCGIWIIYRYISSNELIWWKKSEFNWKSMYVCLQLDSKFIKPKSCRIMLLIEQRFKSNITRNMVMYYDSKSRNYIFNLCFYRINQDHGLYAYKTQTF